MNTLNAIKANLKHHYGSDNFTLHSISKASIASEGALDYFQQAECFWLWDIIATEVLTAVKSNREDTYYFKIISKDCEAELTLHDYRGNLLWNRKIGFTTHPDGEMDLIVGWNGVHSIICLRSEN